MNKLKMLLNSVEKPIGYLLSSFYNYSKKVTSSIRTSLLSVFDLFYYSFIYVEHLLTKRFDFLYYFSLGHIKEIFDKVFFGSFELTRPQSINHDLVLFFSASGLFAFQLFTFNGIIPFTNEGIWLCLLIVACFYLSLYLRNAEELGKDYLTQEIEKLKVDLERNTILAIEALELESQYLDSQIRSLEALELAYLLLTEEDEVDLVSEEHLLPSLDLEFRIQFRSISEAVIQRQFTFDLIQFEEEISELVNELVEEHNYFRPDYV
jgi:hypothetical protein